MASTSNFECKSKAEGSVAIYAATENNFETGVVVQTAEKPQDRSIIAWNQKDNKVIGEIIKNCAVIKDKKFENNSECVENEVSVSSEFKVCQEKGKENLIIQPLVQVKEGKYLALDGKVLYLKHGATGEKLFQKLVESKNELEDATDLGKVKVIFSEDKSGYVSYLDNDKKSLVAVKSADTFIDDSNLITGYTGDKVLYSKLLSANFCKEIVLKKDKCSVKITCSKDDKPEVTILKADGSEDKKLASSNSSCDTKFVFKKDSIDIYNNEGTKSLFKSSQEGSFIFSSTTVKDASEGQFTLENEAKFLFTAQPNSMEVWKIVLITGAVCAVVAIAIGSVFYIRKRKNTA